MYIMPDGTPDPLKIVPLGQRLLIAKMRNYGWTFVSWINDVRVLCFVKKDHTSEIRVTDAGLKVMLGQDRTKKTFIVKTGEAACLQIELRYRKRLEKIHKRLSGDTHGKPND